MRGDLNVTTAPSTARGRITRDKWQGTDELATDAFHILADRGDTASQKLLVEVIAIFRKLCSLIIEGENR